MLSVYETFSSVQGESTHAGRLCFFIRLAGCNLRCPYCDTKKALSPDSGSMKPVNELVALAKESGLSLVEVTGGEPLTQTETPALCAELIKNGFEVLVETNGSIDASALPPEVKRIFDWKTPSSGETASMCEKNFSSLRPHDEVKFVIADDRDFANALEVMSLFGISEKATALFSPASGTMDPSRLVAMMIDSNVKARLNLQIHKYIWGSDAEGV